MSTLQKTSLCFVCFFAVMIGFYTAKPCLSLSYGAEEVSKKYYYATATEYGVKLRKGPGTHFEENKIRLHKNAYGNAPAGIPYDDYIYGLIVDDTVVQGDAKCSAWQKIVVVHTAWNSEELVEPLCETLNGTNSFKCHEDAYICKDFIKTTPVDYEQYLLAVQQKDWMKKGQWVERLRKINNSH